MTIELHRIFTGIKIMERIADFAFNVACSAIKIGNKEHIKLPMRIKKMYELTSVKLKAALEAYHYEDTRTAKKVGVPDGSGWSCMT